MGNCLGRCFGKLDKRRKYLRTRYSVERDISIEFENLMNDDNTVDEMSRLVTDRERQLLSSKQYTELINEQKKLDNELDKKLAEQEEEIRKEEEAYYEARREAARIAKLQKAKEDAAKSKNSSKGTKSWLGDDETEWDVAGGEDDFEMFLASVKARSMKATAHLRKTGSGDGQNSSNSSQSGTNQTRDRSQTEGSSMELEWDHEEGVEPQKKQRSATEENLLAALNRKPRDSPAHSNDLEWDSDFVVADDMDTQQLIAAEKKIIESSAR